MVILHSEIYGFNRQIRRFKKKKEKKNTILKNGFCWVESLALRKKRPIGA